MDDNKTQTPPSDQAMTDQAALVQYVEDLITDRKDPNITDSNREQVKAMLLQEVNDQLNAQLVTLLSEDDQKELDAMLDKNIGDDELNAFFEKKIPNLDTEIAGILLNFRAAYLLPVTQSEQSGEPTLPPMPPAPVKTN